MMMDQMTSKAIGKLDIVIALDSTVSMKSYLEEFRGQVMELIAGLFNKQKDIRVGVVAFGDYCDMSNSRTFGKAFQAVPLTNDVYELLKFMLLFKNSAGGDWAEYYESVLRKIIDETAWRDNSTRIILLIGDAEPHELGYSYKDHVTDNHIDWRAEVKKAAERNIRIDTIRLTGSSWFKELSELTNGTCLSLTNLKSPASSIDPFLLPPYGPLRPFNPNLKDAEQAELNEVFDTYLKSISEL